jgi:hypothetical protein
MPMGMPEGEGEEPPPPGKGRDAKKAEPKKK